MKPKLQQNHKLQPSKTSLENSLSFKTKSELDFETNSELNGKFETIFKNASKTYFYSSLFFPKKIREEINILYAFVRTADDFVDSIPANSVGFFAFKNYYLQNSKVNSRIENLEDLTENLTNLEPNSKQIDKNIENQKNQSLSVLKTNLEPNLQIHSQIKNLNLNKNKKENLEKVKIDKNEINTTKNLEFWQKIVLAFVELEERLEFEKSWTLAFLESMENDLSVQTYDTIEQTCEYIYGSANVIGFFMAKILELPTESYQYAGFLGQSFQYINFIRDIAEDLELGRSYFPQKILQECNLQNLGLAETRQKPEEFQRFIKICLNQYEIWQTEAEKGFKFFPKKYKIAIKTASDMYKWTAKIIASDPFIVYQKKIKPQKRRVLLTGLINWLSL